MKNLITILILTLIPSVMYGQNHRKYIREGNREYQNNEFDKSEIEYRRALDARADADKAVFNLGDALYRMGKYDEAGNEFQRHSEMKSESQSIAAAQFNRGNALLKGGKIEESIEAYKKSLIADPANHQAKYNLAYAQDLLRQQQEQQQQQDKNNKDQDNQDKQDKQDKENQQNNPDKQEDENKDSQNQDQQQQNDDQQPQDQQQREQNQSQEKMTREDAERLLQALANEEKEVQEKVKKEKAAAQRVRVLKNW